MDVHDLTAGYALDALDPDERAQYEEHLGGCERCRDELQDFWRVAGALGRAAGGPPPPASLRERILEQARRERGVVVPPRRTVSTRILSAAAAVAVVVATALGVWGLSLSRELDDTRSELAVLGDPNAQKFRSANGEAELVVTQNGDAALVVRRLAPAPAGKDYEIWVLEAGAPRRAGLFEEPGVALLTRRVKPGQTVAVTLEPDGGLDAPSGDPLFTASHT
ncbi:MAG: anti-sigma factor [Acidimicrobiia bacterium]